MSVARRIIAPLLMAGACLLVASCAKFSSFRRNGFFGGERPRLVASAAPVASSNTWRAVGTPPTAPAAPAAVTTPPPAKVVAASTAAAAPVIAPNSTPATPAPAASAGPAVYRLRPLDPIIIYLRGILPKDDQVEDQIDEQGYIRMTYLKPIKAAGKTATELEDEIERQYIDGKIYRSITVQVVLPSQSYFIEGEVKAPGRIQLVSGMTLMQAIAQAGSFTDYAKRTDVRIVRGGTTTRFNAIEITENPTKDVRIEPGDRIIVGRSIL